MPHANRLVPLVHGFELTGDYNNFLSSSEIAEIQLVLDQTNNMLAEIKKQSDETGEFTLVNLSQTTYGFEREAPLDYNTNPLDNGFRDIEISWNSITLWLTKQDVSALLNLSIGAMVIFSADIIVVTGGLGTVGAAITGGVLTATAAVIQAYTTSPMALKITWEYSDLFSPGVTCQYDYQCRS